MKKIEELSKEELIELIKTLTGQEGLKWDKTEVNKVPAKVEVSESDKSIKSKNLTHLLVEGDNLLSLEYLKKDYLKKVKLFLIDPPYNTGESYMKYQDNRNSSGFRHRDWLNFLEPRLKSCYELGREDSIYALFIDDFNADYLKLLCDQIFGEKNFLGRIVWKCRAGTGISDNFFSPNHEHILLYAKDITKGKFKGDAKDLSKFKNPDKDPRGPWRADTLSAAKPGGDVYYAIKDPVTGAEYLPPKGRYWPYNRIKMQKMIEEGRVIFPRPENNKKNPSKKTFLRELKSETKPVSSWWDQYLTSQGSKSLKALFDGEKVFDYPKPVELFKNLITQACGDDDIVFDPFAGSGTAAQAVIEHNKEQGANIQVVLCTNNENQICEKVTYERVIRVLKKEEVDNGLKYLKIVE